MTDRDPVPLTRIEVLDFVGDAFDAGPLDRDALVAFAAREGARELLVRRLAALPDVRFAGPPELWPHLPDVPEDLRS